MTYNHSLFYYLTTKIHLISQRAKNKQQHRGRFLKRSGRDGASACFMPSFSSSESAAEAAEVDANRKAKRELHQFITVPSK